MSADLSPHTYKPLPTPKAHCKVCLGTERNDFCKAPK